MPPPGPVRAFLSYAHEDHKWRDAVLKHIGWLEHSDQVDAFHDRALKPGEHWDDRIKQELIGSEIVIALISPDFVGSRYCCVDELLPAIERQKAGVADLVPIVCDHVDLGALPIAAHQCLPQDEKNDLKPLRDWRNRNLPLARIAAKIRAMVEARRPPPPPDQIPAPPPAPPAPNVVLASVRPSPAEAPGPGDIPARGRFLGRQTDLDQLVAWILDDAPEPIAVLGTGGIGKSKLTIAALHDPRCVDRFGDRRLFVRLEDARDEAEIYRAVARELGLDADTRPLAAVAAALRVSPALIVLDNAETPWEAEPLGAEQAFARLAELTGVRLVISLRGFELPGVANWRPMLIEPLPVDPSRALFLAIASNKFAADPMLAALLERLDGLPLAIELVAHRAQAEPDASTVLRQWQTEHGRYARRGPAGGKEVDLAASIELSLASPRMTVPGRRLFALLGLLPHGLARADLASVMPADGDSATAALTRTGLILRGTERLRMLAPVREHAATYRPASSDEQRLVEHFSTIAETLPLRWTHPRDETTTASALGELANIERVLGLMLVEIKTNEMSQVAWRWVRVGDARWTVGGSRFAGEAYETAQKVFAARLAEADDDVECGYGLGLVLGRLYYVLRAWGDISAAILVATRSLSQLSDLARQRPNDARVKHELSWSWGRLGEGWQAQGNLDQALQAYQSCRETLAELPDFERRDLQRDVAWAYGRIGSVLLAQCKLAPAVDAIRKSHWIISRLANADIDNNELQHDLSVSLLRLGSAVLVNNLQMALACFTESAEIADRLMSNEPMNMQRRTDLAWSLRYVGDAYLACDDLDSAVATFERMHSILVPLSSFDPENAEWRHDASICFEKLASIRERRGDRVAALAYWQQALAMSESLAESFPELVDMRATPALHLAGVARNLDPADPASRADAATLLDRALALLRPLAAAGKLDAKRRGWFTVVEKQRIAVSAAVQP